MRDGIEPPSVHVLSLSDSPESLESDEDRRRGGRAAVPTRLRSLPRGATTVFMKYLSVRYFTRQKVLQFSPPKGNKNGKEIRRKSRRHGSRERAELQDEGSEGRVPAIHWAVKWRHLTPFFTILMQIGGGKRSGLVSAIYSTPWSDPLARRGCVCATPPSAIAARVLSQDFLVA